jgi:hypothetical protein
MPKDLFGSFASDYQDFFETLEAGSPAWHFFRDLIEVMRTQRERQVTDSDYAGYST